MTVATAGHHRDTGEDRGIGSLCGAADPRHLPPAMMDILEFAVSLWPANAAGHHRDTGEDRSIGSLCGAAHLRDLPLATVTVLEFAI